MKTILVVAAGVLVALGSAVSGTFNGDDDRHSASVETSQVHLASSGAELLAKWEKQSALPAFVPMQRPL